MNLVIPEGYKPAIDIKETNVAIKKLRTTLKEIQSS